MAKYSKQYTSHFTSIIMKQSKLMLHKAVSKRKK